MAAIPNAPSPSQLRGRLGGIWAGFEPEDRREVRKMVGAGSSWADAVEKIFARQMDAWDRRDT